MREEDGEARVFVDGPGVLGGVIMRSELDIVKEISKENEGDAQRQPTYRGATALYARVVRSVVVIEASLVLATPRRPQRVAAHRRPGREWHNSRMRPAMTDMN